MRKAAEPKRSGAQTSRFSWCVESPSCMASSVLMLNRRVPTNWTAALHHEGSAAHRPSLNVESRSSSSAASVKNTEPAKNTAPSAPAPTSWTNPGKGPMKKQAEPTAKPIAIQQSQAARAAIRGAKARARPIKVAPGSRIDSMCVRCGRIAPRG